MVHNVVKVRRRDKDPGDAVGLCGTNKPSPPLVCSAVSLPTASSAPCCNESSDGQTCGASLRLRFRVHQLLHHQVYIDDGTEVESPVEETVAYKLGDKRPHEGEGKPLREHFP